MMEKTEKEFFAELIEAVRHEHILYIKSSAGYMNKNERRKAWERISSQLGKSEEECERRWILLREKYAREMKKQEKSSGCGASTSEEWEYFHSMSFLKPYIKPRKTRSNASHVENRVEVVYSSDSSISEPFSPPTLKRQKKRDDRLDDVHEEFKKTIGDFREKLFDKKEDEDTLFMKCITSFMKNLPEKDKNDLRKSFLDQVIEKRNIYFSREH